MRFEGVFSLLTTPYLPDGSIDWDAYDAVIDHHVNSGVQGLFAVCGTSEMRVLSQPERIALAERVAARSTIPVVATANADANQDAHGEYVEAMQATGVDGIVLVPPPNKAPSDEALADYYKGLLARVQIPVFLYEWPGQPDRYVDAAMYEQLVAAGVQGIKDTTCTMEGIEAKIAVKGDSTIFQAHAAHMLDAMRAGARGMMAILTTGAPRVAARWWQAFVEDPYSPEMERWNELLLELNDIAGLDHPRSSQYLLQLQGVPLRVASRGKADTPFSDDVKARVDAWWARVQPMVDGGL